MRTLCIMNYKGGVGKTTTAVNMAYSLGEMGNKILLVDADQQGNSTYIATRRAYTGKTLRDVMKGAGIRSAIKRSAWSPNVDVVPAKEEMEAVAADPDTLREKLKEVEQEYDYCIIDCHPDMQIMTINALMASDDLLIPMKPDKFSETALEIMGEYFMQITEYNPEVTVKEIREYKKTVSSNDTKKEPTAPVNTGQSEDSGREQEPVREKAESEPVNTGAPQSFMPDQAGPKEEPEKRTIFDFLKEGSRNEIANWMNETFICPQNAECMIDDQMEEEAKKGRCRVCWHEFLRREYK